MKTLLILPIFLLFSYCLSAQVCTSVTSQIQNNYQCSGSWVPDITACWTYGGPYCYVGIKNNSTTEDLIVDFSCTGGSYNNVTINPQTNHTFRISPIAGTVDLDFSSSAHSNTCISSFYMDCL